MHVRLIFQQFADKCLVSYNKESIVSVSYSVSQQIKINKKMSTEMSLGESHSDYAQIWSSSTPVSTTTKRYDTATILYGEEVKMSIYTLIIDIFSRFLHSYFILIDFSVLTRSLFIRRII